MKGNSFKIKDRMPSIFLRIEVNYLVFSTAQSNFLQFGRELDGKQNVQMKLYHTINVK